VIAQPLDREPQRISVKSRTFRGGGDAFVDYLETDTFDWLAVVLLPGGSETRRRLFVIPRKLADETARRNKPTTKTANSRYWRIDQVPELFAAYEGNFTLDHSGTHNDTVRVTL
jgi:hypothetical protein